VSSLSLAADGRIAHETPPSATVWAKDAPLGDSQPLSFCHVAYSFEGPLDAHELGFFVPLLLTSNSVGRLPPSV